MKSTANTLRTIAIMNAFGVIGPRCPCLWLCGAAWTAENEAAASNAPEIKVENFMDKNRWKIKSLIAAVIRGQSTEGTGDSWCTEHTIYR